MRPVTLISFAVFALSGLSAADGAITWLRGALIGISLLGMGVGVVLCWSHSNCPACGLPMRPSRHALFGLVIPLFPLPKVCPHCHIDLETGLPSDADERSR